MRGRLWKDREMKGIEGDEKEGKKWKNENERKERRKIKKRGAECYEKMDKTPPWPRMVSAKT